MGRGLSKLQRLIVDLARTKEQIEHRDVLALANSPQAASRALRRLWERGILEKYRRLARSQHGLLFYRLKH